MENNGIKDIIRGVDFHFNKALGQNFITDANLLDAIVADSGITSDDTVVEIGTGAGTLTRAIAKVAKRFILSRWTEICSPCLRSPFKA